LVALINPVITTQGYTSPELSRIFRRARTLVKKAEDVRDSFWVLTLLKSYYNISGDPKNSRDIAAQILKMARRSQDIALLVTAHSRMIANCLYYAQWEALQKHLKQTIRGYHIEEHRGIVHRIGSDPKGNALSFAALGTWIMGFPNRARRYCQESLDLAEELANPMVSWFANYYAAYFHGYAGEPREAKIFVEKALRICDEQDLAYYRIYSQAWSGWIRAEDGDEDGMFLLDQGVNRLRQTGDRMNLMLFLRLQASACLKAQKGSKALDVISEALDLSQKTQIIYEKPELMRLKGEIQLAQSPDNLDDAWDCYNQAIESAAISQSKSWELRATVSLARLLAKNGRQEEACQRLQVILGWFSEGFHTKDLIEAKILLAELCPGMTQLER
jgi:tetratricopeptide (TPR) repeat protein